jgi:hypothetical protein
LCFDRKGNHRHQIPITATFKNQVRGLGYSHNELESVLVLSIKSMTVLTLLHPMAPITTPSSTSTSQQQQKIPLRRATYIHISDLTSAYNIDNIQLEKEMSRVNAKRNKLQDVSSHNNDQDEGSKDDDGKTGTPDEDPDLEVALGPVVPQKRLQPPRGGFNLCM